MLRYLNYSTPVAALALLATMVASPLSAQAQAPKRGGTVIIAISVDPGAVNPAITTSVPDQVGGCMLYEGLTKVSGDRILPALAKSWTVSPDGQTYTFQLQKAQWHDGKPFTSADVKFSLIDVNSKITPAFATAAGRMIEGIDTPAPDQAVIRLKQPFGPLLLSLSCTQGGAILPKHVFEGQNVLTHTATKEAPVGTGPFKLAEWKRGDHLRLNRNPDYWEPGKPYLDSVIIKTIPQPSARLQALTTGEVDYIPYYFMPGSDLPQVRANAKLTTSPTKVAPAQDMLFINVKKKPLDDKRVRQALMMATDRDYLVKNAFLGLGDVPIAPFTTKIKWTINPEVDYRKMYPFDPAKANALLDEAGLKRGADGTRFNVKINFAADESDFERTAVALKSMWKAVGVDVTVDALDRSIVEKRTFIDSDFDTHINGYTSYGDPALGLSRIWVTASIGKPYGNASGYSNPEVDDLFAQGEKAVTEADRAKIYQKIQAIEAVDLPVLTIRERMAFNAYTATIQGLDNDAYLPTWADAWIKN